MGNGLGQIEALDVAAARFVGAVKGLAGGFPCCCLASQPACMLACLQGCAVLLAVACRAAAPQRLPTHPSHCTALPCPAGAVRSLAVHPQGSVLASVGLDRYLRLHSVHTRQLLAKAYCKTLPTGAPPLPACLLQPRSACCSRALPPAFVMAVRIAAGCACQTPRWQAMAWPLAWFAHRAGVAFCPTDASMLPPVEQKSAEGQKQRRRRRRGAGSDDDAEEGDASSEEEGSEEEQKQARQHKRGKPQGEGGSGRKQGIRDRR